MIFVIVGPTASGKSALAEALASRLQGAIVNGDAFQVYQGFDIGTAKPSLATRALIPHYLYDFVSPEVDYDVKRYQSDLRATLDFLTKKGQPIILVGGTGLYVKAGLFDYDFTDEDPVDLSDVEKLEDDALYAYLVASDPAEAAKLHPHNRRRVLRAIAIGRARGEKKSDLIARQDHRCLYEAIFIGLNPPRESLYEAVNGRVDQMLASGLVEETKHLLAHYPPTSHAFMAIGYREAVRYLKGELTPEAMRKAMQQSTRNYVKRQMTFFRHQLPVTWFEDAETALRAALSKAGDFHG